MPKLWTQPYYSMTTRSGKTVTIDVTTSVAPGIPPHEVVTDEVSALFKEKGIQRIVDFGAGALRHVFPLLDKGFQVCAVEFKETFERPACQEALREARKHQNFSALVWPAEFISDRRRFDAALLCYVLQTMPIARERQAVLKYLYKKLREDAYLIYMSRFGQLTEGDRPHRVGDGYYRWPDRETHSFYREFTTEETHDFVQSFRFERLRSLSARGTEQVLVYRKGSATWV